MILQPLLIVLVIVFASGEDLECDDNKFPIISNGRPLKYVVSKPYKPGTAIPIGCNEDYKKVGDPETICKSDGHWRTTSRYPCVRICDNPPELGHDIFGYINVTELDRRYERNFTDPAYLRGDQVPIHCDEGFVELDDPVIQCSDSGEWKVIPNVPCINSSLVRYVKNNCFDEPLAMGLVVGGWLSFLIVTAILITVICMIVQRKPLLMEGKDIKSTTQVNSAVVKEYGSSSPSNLSSTEPITSQLSANVSSSMEGIYQNVNLVDNELYGQINLSQKATDTENEDVYSELSRK